LFAAAIGVENVWLRVRVLQKEEFIREH